MLENSEKICNICGGNQFSDQPRTSRYGLPPTCIKCGSGERQRVIRKIYDKISPEIFKQRKALQFSNDNSVKREAFASFEVSMYGRDNSLDMMAIERPDESYDWIISNHVLEHIADDSLAVKELLRILKPQGIIHINIPNPAYNLETRDWGYPDSKIYDHYRHYGSDFLLRMEPVLQNVYALQVIDIDCVTETIEMVYLIAKSFVPLRQIGLQLQKSRCVVIRGR
jgi:predicted SAM-dependent methyltransferase